LRYSPPAICARREEDAMGRDPSQESLLSDSLRAHLLRFAVPLSPRHDGAAGTRVLVAFAGVAFGLFIALRALIDAIGLRGWPPATTGFVLALSLAFFALHRYYVRIGFAEIGLRGWPAWTRRERLYLLQVVPMAVVAFAFVFHAHLGTLLERHGLAGFLLFSLATGMLWGMVQEFLYRGWLQTELTRRFGAATGLLAANLVFTFGPLHFNYLTQAVGVNWAGLAAVFGIGLFFGLVYQRSGNLWIPALLHGLWPPNMS
jgi:membrane protease YdiL (CAAX protease family)